MWIHSIVLTMCLAVQPCTNTNCRLMSLASYHSVHCVANSSWQLHRCQCRQATSYCIAAAPKCFHPARQCCHFPNTPAYAKTLPTGDASLWLATNKSL